MMHMKNTYFTHDELKQALKKFRAQQDDVQHSVVVILSVTTTTVIIMIIIIIILTFYTVSRKLPWKHGFLIVVGRQLCSCLQAECGHRIVGECLFTEPDSFGEFLREGIVVCATSAGPAPPWRQCAGSVATDRNRLQRSTCPAVAHCLPTSQQET